MDRKKVILVLGLTLVTLSLVGISFSLYLICNQLKEEEIQIDWSFSDLLSGAFGESRDTIESYELPDDHCIRVPTFLVTKLIGFRGEYINRLEHRTDTLIHVSEEVLNAKIRRKVVKTDFSFKVYPLINEWKEGFEAEEDNNNEENTEMFGLQLICITGSEDNIARVEKMVNDLMDSNKIESIPIPDGCNIGDDQQLQNIEIQSGARVRLVGHNFAQNRSVFIFGDGKERDNAKQMINKIVEQFWHKSKG